MSFICSYVLMLSCMSLASSSVFRMSRSSCTSDEPDEPDRSEGGALSSGEAGELSAEDESRDDVRRLPCGRPGGRGCGCGNSCCCAACSACSKLSAKPRISWLCRARDMRFGLAATGSGSVRDIRDSRAVKLTDLRDCAPPGLLLPAAAMDGRLAPARVRRSHTPFAVDAPARGSWQLLRDAVAEARMPERQAKESRRGASSAPSSIAST